MLGLAWPGCIASRRLRAQAALAGRDSALLQLASGLGNVLLGWPLVAAVAHTGGAAALVVVLTWTLVRKPSRADAGADWRWGAPRPLDFV